MSKKMQSSYKIPALKTAIGLNFRLAFIYRPHMKGSAMIKMHKSLKVLRTPER